MVFFPPREIVAALITPGVTMDYAADIIEEHVIHRRAKGDSLIDVSNTLNQIERRVPRAAPAVRQARYITNIPPPSELTPPPTAAGHPAAASTTTLLRYLTSTPTPSIQRSREVVLEYVLNREARLREKKPGRGGKGTLSREGCEEIAASLAEIEDGLRGTGTLAERGVVRDHFVPDEDLDSGRQLGLALVLSLRMLLSYFTLPELARQILALPPSDAERTLVQHIRRRVAGEGRFAVARELEYVESLTLSRRPALRPAFRSARARTLLPSKVPYMITLPAPSKSSCVKLLSSFIRDIEHGGPNAAVAYMGTGLQSPLGPERTSFGTKKRSPRMSDTPLVPASTTSPHRAQVQLPKDHKPIEAYALELLSEYITREKREHMLKNRWAKSGREQLGRDLGDIEAAVCLAGKNTASKQAPTLVPVFLELRRTFALPVTPLPRSIVDPYYDVLPERPDPDSIPLREPTVSSVTASLYVNPRLDNATAVSIIEELLESEREKGVNASVSEEKTVSWLNGQIEQIEKRFPDGSYQTAFEHARYLAAHPRVMGDAQVLSASPGKIRDSHRRYEQDSSALHRRTKSNGNLLSPNDDFGPSAEMSPPNPMFRSHSRSASLPLRVRTGSGYSTLSSDRSSYEVSSPDPIVAKASPRDEPAPLQGAGEGEERIASDGDSDSIDSEFARQVAPFPQVTTPVSPQTPASASPRAEVVNTRPVLSLDFESPSKTSPGGWWDVLTSPAKLPDSEQESSKQLPPGETTTAARLRANGPGSAEARSTGVQEVPGKLADRQPIGRTWSAVETVEGRPAPERSIEATWNGAHLDALRKLDPSVAPPGVSSRVSDPPSSPIDISGPGILLNLGSTQRRSGASTPTNGTPVTPTFSRSSAGLGLSLPKSPAPPTPTLDQLISEEDDFARGVASSATSAQAPRPTFSQHARTISNGSTGYSSRGRASNAFVAPDLRRRMSNGQIAPAPSKPALNGSGASTPDGHTARTRPPPVPVMIDRPSFPSTPTNGSPVLSPTVPVTPRSPAVPASPDPQPQYGSYNSLIPATRPVPLNMDRISASFGNPSPLTSPTGPTTPASAIEQRYSKSRLGSMGRSVPKAVSGPGPQAPQKPPEMEYTYQRRTYYNVPPLQPKHYSQTPLAAHTTQPPPQPRPLQPLQPVPDSNIAAHISASRRGSHVENNPAKWNRSMVAGIMGPPAER